MESSSSLNSTNEILTDLYKWEVKRTLKRVKAPSHLPNIRGMYAIISIFVLAFLIFVGGMLYYYKEWEHKRSGHVSARCTTVVERAPGTDGDSTIMLRGGAV